jgi:hypothetical protein
MDSDWREQQKKRDHIFDICGAVAGALVLVIMLPSGPLMTLFYGVCGGFIGMMTARMRTCADGWLGWLGAICFWWGLPLLFWLFGD